MQAERAKNTYPEAQLVTFVLTGLNPMRRTNYQLIAAIFQEKLQNNETILFSDLEHRFLAADETPQDEAKNEAYRHQVSPLSLPCREW